MSEAGEGARLPTPGSYSSSPRVSPDGRWIAYQSNESDMVEIYVRSFPDGREKQQLSTAGGMRPVWRRDGRELYYLTPDRDLMAVSLTTAPTLGISGQQKLFRAPVDPTLTLVASQYDVSPDGTRFLLIVPDAEPRRPVNIVLNWQSLLPK